MAGTWKLQQRFNPDGTPYRSKLEGVTYISLTRKTGSTVGPHAVATLYSKETGIADTNFFAYPADVANRPFEMESTGTWLLHNVQTSADGAEIVARTYTMAKGTLQPYRNGMVLSADVHYNVSRAAPKAGLAAVPTMRVLKVVPGQLTDMSGARVQPTALTGACCGMTNLTLTGNRMEITWNNKGRDVWVRSSTSVPAAFR
jgi:hypothetical protein